MICGQKWEKVTNYYLYVTFLWKKKRIISLNRVNFKVTQTNFGFHYVFLANNSFFILNLKTLNLAKHKIFSFADILKFVRPPLEKNNLNFELKKLLRMEVGRVWRPLARASSSSIMCTVVLAYQLSLNNEQWTS